MWYPETTPKTRLPAPHPHSHCSALQMHLCPRNSKMELRRAMIAEALLNCPSLLASSVAAAGFWPLPLLRPVLVVIATLLSISGIGYFEVNYVMTGGGPRDLTNILGVYAYDQAFSFYRFDYAAAASSVILILTSFIAFFYIRYLLKED